MKARVAESSGRPGELSTSCTLGGAVIPEWAGEEPRRESRGPAGLRRILPCSSSDFSPLHCGHVPPHEHLRCSPGLPPPFTAGGVKATSSGMRITCLAAWFASRSKGVRRAHFKLRLHRPRERSCTLHRSGPVHPAGIRPVAVTRPMQRDVAEVPREFRNAGDFRLGYFRLPAEISGPACARSPRGFSLWRTFGDSNACKHLATSLHATAPRYSQVATMLLPAPKSSRRDLSDPMYRSAQKLWERSMAPNEPRVN
jgi:hypothetical protein